MKTKSIAAAFAALILPALASAQTPAVMTEALSGNPAERGVPATDTAPAAAGDSALALHQQSIEQLQQKKAKEAVGFAERATQADPTKPEYFSQLGIALSVRMGELNFMQQAMTAGKMRQALEKSIALDPNHVPGLIGLTRYYTNAPEIAGGSLTKAAEFARRVQQLDPFVGTIELARISEQADKFAEALVGYETAARLKPDNAGMQNACGRMLAKLGRNNEARARFEAALTLNPDLEPAKKGLAELDQPAK